LQSIDHRRRKVAGQNGILRIIFERTTGKRRPADILPGTQKDMNTESPAFRSKCRTHLS
jgi:hypothetical protein